MPVRPSTLFAALLIMLAMCAAVMMVFGYTVLRTGHRRNLDLMAHQVASLQLTDLCLFTEASYTRHLTQTDGYTAFQDHPMALEHFPSGSITLPKAYVFER